MNLTFNAGCGSRCGCTNPKPSQVHEPSPRPKPSINYNQNPNPRISLTNSSTTSGEPNATISPDNDVFTSTSISEPETDHNKNCSGHISFMKKSPKLVDSIAVEKDSEDLYNDFRYSMLQMIFEKDIYSEADLQDLLQCFLQLNLLELVRMFLMLSEEKNQGILLNGIVSYWVLGRLWSSAVTVHSFRIRSKNPFFAPFAHPISPVDV